MKISNLFSDFDDLTKTKLLSNSASNYTDKNYNLNTPTPGLNQGSNFKKYQKKIKGLVNKEGFENLNDKLDSNIFNLEPNGLTNQSKNIIQQSDYSSQQQIIDNLRKEYQNTLGEYQELQAKISGSTSGYLNRVNPNNPYLGKNVRFSDGAICYVTKQGIVKYYGNMDILDGTSGKNGCPPQSWTQLDIEFIPYMTPGSKIPTEPPLITGTPMIQGQSCGNEGTNLFVDKLIYQPTSSNIGCYNNTPPSTDVIFVPIMNDTNNVNNYKSFASSIYQDNNSFAGPWAGFDRNPNTFWHSKDVSGYMYDATNGEYLGNTSVPVNTSSGVQTIKGEYLQISLPNINSESADSYPLTKYDLQGRQGCCGNPNGRSPNSWYILGYNNSDQQWYQVDVQENQSLSYELRTYTVSNTTPYSAYIFMTTNCGNPGDKSGNRYCVQISQWNLYTSSNLTNSTKSAMTNVGKMTYENCSLYALNSGNKYFGITQSDEDELPFCLVSNDLAGSQQYGVGNNYGMTPLWDSKTPNTSGVMAKMSSSGSLTVLNSSGASIFATPNNESGGDSSYLGCYADTTERAMQNTSNNQYLPLEQCKQLAIDNKFSYYGIQDAHGGDNGWCVGSNDLNSSMKYGVANNCTKNSSEKYVGAGWSNAVYSTNSDGQYFLILQDDGNMCIYRGTSPSDNQGVIWASGTNGYQKDPNPNFSASKSQFSRNYLLVNEILLTNQFVGSNDGSIYLIMQSDGNLVLYTNSVSSSCSPSKTGKYNIGKENTNSLYEMNEMGNMSNLGNLAYVDEDAQLHDYPSTNTKYSNTYTLFDGNSPYSDIANAAYSNATTDQCKSTCDANEECAGYVFDNKNNVCWPKTTGMYPNGQLYPNDSSNSYKTYVRNKMATNLPVGVSDKVKNIDSLMYQNYVNGGEMKSNYSLTQATSVEQQQLEQLESKLNLLSNQISETTTKFGKGSQIAQEQSEKNVKGLKGYLTDLNKTANKINQFSSFDNIVKDSDIVVLQKNYDYLFWSILAAGTVLISMNIIKNK